MKKEKIIGLAILTGGALVAAFLLFNAASAQEASIAYPVAELGNCGSKTECKTYCDDPGHLEACLNFAEKNNLMAKEEIDRGRQFAKAGGKGPGGCSNKEACENYCNDMNKINECVAFAEKNNIVPPAELAEMKKVQTAINQGIKPPACRNKQECDSYCSAPEHMEECITFAQAAGMMPKDEGEKVLNALRQGIKPPACRGQEECDQYCSSDEHFEECLKFSEAAGMMKPEDAAMARKTGGKGPGGCRGRECETFCQKPENQETCFNFAKENGLMKPEELQNIENQKQMMVQQLQQTPPEIISCLEQNLGADKINQLKSGQGMPTREMGEQMRTCFEQNKDKMGPPADGAPGQEGQFRPCTNPEECKNFGPANGQGQPPTMNQNQPPQGEFRGGPGGCQSPEECQNFCQSNPDACVPPDGGLGQQQGGQPNGPQQMMEQRPLEGQMINGERFEFPNQQQMQEMIQRREGENTQPQGQMMPQQGQMPPEGFQNFQGDPNQFRQMMNPPAGGQQPPEGFQQNFQPDQQQMMNFQQQPPQDIMQQQPMMEQRPPDGGQQMGPPPGGQPAPENQPQGVRPTGNFFSQILGVFMNILKTTR